MAQRRNGWTVITSALTFSALAPGCAENGPGGPVDREAAIDDYIESLGRIPTDEPGTVEGERSDPVRDGDYRCVYQPVEQTRQHDELVAYQSNSESFWPGSILSGESIRTGQFSPLVFDRAPLTVSISLENLAGDKSVVVEEPSLSAFREAMTGILDAEVTGATPANMYTEIEEVHSEQQLALALGVNLSGVGLPGKIASSFDFADQNIRSRYVVQYTQAYYTIDLDQPRRPSHFFDDAVTLEDVSAKMGPGDPPTYVSSITYGRKVIFTFESEFSRSELASALEFAYETGVDVGGEVSASSKEVLSRSRITAYILGGSGGDAAESLESYEDIMEFIASGGNYSKDSPGAPIAYKLSYLADNAPARLSFTDEYTVAECERVSQEVLVTLKGIEVVDAGRDSGGDVEIFGTIEVEADSSASFFDRDEQNFVRIGHGQTWPLNDIIAQETMRVTPQPGESIALEADLWERDRLSYSQIGHEVVDVSYETGWRRQVPIRLTGGNLEVNAIFELTPI